VKEPAARAPRAAGLGWAAGFTKTMGGFYWLARDAVSSPSANSRRRCCLVFMAILCGLPGWSNRPFRDENHSSGCRRLVSSLSRLIIENRRDLDGAPTHAGLASGPVFASVASFAGELRYPLLFPWYYRARRCNSGARRLTQSAELGNPIGRRLTAGRGSRTNLDGHKTSQSSLAVAEVSWSGPGAGVFLLGVKREKRGRSQGRGERKVWCSWRGKERGEGKEGEEGKKEGKKKKGRGKEKGEAKRSQRPRAEGCRGEHESSWGQRHAPGEGLLRPDADAELQAWKTSARSRGLDETGWSVASSTRPKTTWISVDYPYREAAFKTRRPPRSLLSLAVFGAVPLKSSRCRTCRRYVLFQQTRCSRPEGRHPRPLGDKTYLARIRQFFPLGDTFPIPTTGRPNTAASSRMERAVKAVVCWGEHKITPSPTSASEDVDPRLS